jgi:murein DD-endopeptidase MepM/ murein hydrolase activator NlpD
MKEKKENNKKKWLNGERRFYLLTAIGCAVALFAIITVAVVVSNNGFQKQPSVNTGVNNEQQKPDDEKGDDEQVVVTPEGLVMPMETVSVLNEYGFYHNQITGAYYQHQGIDFYAEAGTSVLAVDAGTVESIYKDNLLTGTEIVVAHDDGLKSVYRFVDEIDGLKVGDKVEKGEKIATVAQACGNEYKDGPHLHLELHKNGVNVDPATYLTLEEK